MPPVDLAPLVTRTFQRKRLQSALPASGALEALSPAFARLLADALRPESEVIDLGTGEGRAALAAAAGARRVVGVDRDLQALEVARGRARELGLTNVEFRAVDLERAGLLSRDLRRRLGAPGGFDLALAHLCVSDRILKRAAALSRPGGRAVITALHSDHWHETGAGSRFAYDQRRLLRAVRAARLAPLKVQIETTEISFPTLEALRDLYLGGPWAARLRIWREDGRWGILEERFRAGRRTLTTSRITALARRGGVLR